MSIKLVFPILFMFCLPSCEKDEVEVVAPPVVYGEVSDIDGNKYQTTKIGDQTWMANNLRATKYNDGTAIPKASSQNDFRLSAKEAYTFYNTDVSQADKYGYLYNGLVIISDKNVCMEGWHIPSSSEWNSLATTLGGFDVAGGKMKAVSDLWKTPNRDADNVSGFSGLPGGSYCRVCLSNSGIFADESTDGYWWSKQVLEFFYLTNHRADLRTKNIADLNDGLSIRCVKD